MSMQLGWVEIRNFLIVLGVFLAIDIVWLAFISRALYAKYLGYLMAPKVNFVAAFIFYIIFVIGLLYFVINPALAKGDLMAAILPGMFFGLIAYATYDLTNLATIRDWPMLITSIDLVWGSFLSAATCGLSYLIIKAIS